MIIRCRREHVTQMARNLHVAQHSRLYPTPTNSTRGGPSFGRYAPLVQTVRSVAIWSPQKKRAMKHSHGIKKYLTLYNAVETILWFSVLARLFFVAQVSDLKEAHDQVSTFLLWVQTSAILEVVHVALGLVPSPLLTTMIQVASRLVLVWGIDYLFPHITPHSAAFASMVTAWSITEILRYSYYAINLQGDVPKLLMWLRYSLFYILYPLGAGSEAWLVYLSLDEARKLSPAYALFLKGLLVTYPPGFYFLYTYMIKQRKKMFKRQGKKVVRE